MSQEIKTHTTLEINRAVDGKDYVVLKQVVDFPSGKKESVVVLKPSEFEEMLKTYQALKSVINAFNEVQP